MKKQSLLFLVLISLFAIGQMGMASREGQYDEEARAEERAAKRLAKSEKSDKRPAREFAGGVKQMTVDTTAGFLSETAESTKEDPPVVGTLEGARLGSGQVLDNAVKGAVKVATLGYGSIDEYEVTEPESGTDETTKITIKIPGT